MTMSKDIHFTDAQLLRLVNDLVAPSCRRQDYLKTLSTTKLIKIADRVIGSSLPCYSGTEDIYIEMIRRLKRVSKYENIIGKMEKEMVYENKKPVAEEKPNE